MTEERDARLREATELFGELVELAADQAEARLKQVETADPLLARLVRDLLAADRAAGETFLEEGAAAWAPALVERLLAEESAEDESAAGQSVGPYRLVEILGRGGMGEVWIAERSDGQFEQEVALKLLKRGIDSEGIRRRFLQERQVLARLEHPHIARLLDGGTADGRPYFVMELVRGEPITDYCRKRSLPLAERLRLVATCCEAVDDAHRHLVVHRDIKPSNVLVTDDGRVKLLDFGIAKVLSEDQEPTQTRAEERALTPTYAAPEQILGEPVTTATDVYALGVVLYELLTGAPPHERSGRSAARLASQVERETAEKPSRAAERQGATAAAFPPREKKKLKALLEGDLDAIVLKALRREPERRYPGAAALAEDLRRSLSGQRVEARPDTFLYRAGKFVRRHRVGVVAAAAVVLAVLAGLLGTVWQARRAQANAREATAQARQAQRVKEFLIGLFEVADPEQSGGETISARQLLEQGTRRLTTELSTEPAVQSDLLEAVARINRSLGLLDPGATLAEQSLRIRRQRSAEDAGIGASLATLGSIRMSQGRLDEAERQLKRGLSILEAREPPGSLTLARVRSDYGQLLFWKGQVAEAEKLESQVYETYRQELGEANVLTAIHLRNTGVLLEELDRLDDAEHAYRLSQATLERALGPDHPNMAQSYLNLAVLLDRRGQAAVAEPLYRRSLAVRRKTLGPSHQATGQSLQLLALFLLNQGRLDDSEATYREALALFRSINPKHFEVGKCLNGLALIEGRRGRFAAAEQTLGQVVALFREALGEKHPFTWQATGNMAEQIALQGRLAEAEAMLRQVAARLEEINGAASAETAEAWGRLGETLSRRGAAADAVPFCRRALEVQRKVGGAENLSVALASYQLGSALGQLPDENARTEAQGLLAHSASLYRKLKPDHVRLPDVLLASGRLAASRGDRERARGELAEAAALFERTFAPGDPRARRAREAQREAALLR